MEAIAIATDTARPATRPELAHRLDAVWTEFSARLLATPSMARILDGRAALPEYRSLLLNLRQQVVEGGCWLARAASHMDMAHFALRSAFIRHAATEHLDYQMLEDDYVKVGGRADDLVATPKNIGSEALSAWMYHTTSQRNPCAVLGALFIIEGVGSRVAPLIAARLAEHLRLEPDQMKFIRYHAANDDDHQRQMNKILSGAYITPAVADGIVKSARVTGLLYALQFEMLGQC